MNQFVTPNAKTVTAVNPATGDVLGEALHTPEDQYASIFQRARQAQKVWAKQSFAQRRTHLVKMRNYIRDHAGELARLVSDSNGKTRMDALITEVLPCQLACDWYSKHAAKVLAPERRGPSSLIWMGKRSEVRHEPLGVVGIISPWNYPLSIPFGEILMGLMAGNAIVLKVAAATPLVGKAIEDIIAAGELPSGLFSHIIGSGGQVSTAMFEHGIDKLFFTGSVPTGKQIMAQAAQTLTPVSLELGGKDPMIVLEDADLERAANGAAWAGYQNAGQSCGGVERIYVHESVYDRFVTLLADRTRALQHGVPNDECDVDIGSMTTANQRLIVEKQLAEALEAGATIVAQSEGPVHGPGHFHAATLVTGVDHGMTLMREETFGPILPVMPFRTEDEAVELANDSPMALTASIWTRDTRYGKKLANRINGGVVAINDHLYTHAMSDVPWGGPGDSGIGRTHGPEGLKEMSKLKVVNWDWLRARRNLWWYPQDKASYAAIRSALYLVAPRTVLDFLRSAIRVLPTMIRKMYF
ncbi:MAG: aldehyde dehydrogenase family protein [Marinobacter sp.]|nr:aldehyde dehydrogenase family protein [Marinobacter sp.]